MRYVVVDFEWNQDMQPRSPRNVEPPIPLKGEIIQIGAVLLDEWSHIIDAYEAFVKPKYYRSLHYRVKKLTGITPEQLSGGIPFPEMLREFREWSGDDCLYLTWGPDDRVILQENLSLHGFDTGWMERWHDLQFFFRMESGDGNQKGLGAALEYFEIEPSRQQHDALNDAMDAAEVAACLNLEADLARRESFLQEQEAARRERRAAAHPPKEEEAPPYLSRETFSGKSRDGLYALLRETPLPCPKCGEPLEIDGWYQEWRYGQRYVGLARCPEEEAEYLARLRFSSNAEGRRVVRLLYPGDSHSRKTFRKWRRAKPAFPAGCQKQEVTV